MKSSRLLLLAFFLIGNAPLNSCNFSTKPSKIEVSDDASNIDSNQVHDVSIVNLIANPKAYNKGRVRIIGYVNLEFENNAVYLNKEDFLSKISKNAIWLELTHDEIRNKSYKDNNNKNVLIEGTFSVKQGHENSFSGSLTNITRLEAWAN